VRGRGVSIPHACFLLCRSAGRATIEALLKLHPGKVHIRAVLRSKKNAAQLKDLPVEVFESDIMRPQLHDGLWKGMVNSAYFATPQTEDRAMLAKKFIDLCAENGVDYPIILSMTCADAKASLFHKQMAEVEEYAASKKGMTIKAQAWDKGKNLLLPIILRVPFFYQNLFSNAAEVKEKAVFAHCMQSGLLPFVDVEDIGKCIASILVNSAPFAGKTFNLIAEYTSGNKIASLLSRVTGKTTCYDTLEADQYRAVLKSYNMPEWQINGLIEHLDFFSGGQGQDLSCDDIKEICGDEAIKTTQFIREKMKPLVV
jgi:uncharacterized protein YbjT (DUF2867 family)